MPSVSIMQTVLTFSDLWDRTAREHGDRPFLVFRDADGELSRWTYAEFDALVDQVASRLHSLGVDPGSSVQLVLRNCPAFVAVWLAASRLGAWIVPVDPSSTARDIANQVARTRPTVTVCASDRRDVVEEGAGGGVRHVLALTETAADLGPGSVLLAPPGGETPPHRPAPGDRIAVMFTSGTTSVPKGVVLTQAGYRHVADVMARLALLGSQHRWYVSLPLFHANAQYYCFASAIAVGASVGLTARFTASRWPHEAAELEATHASLFAAPIRMILARRRHDAPRLQLAHVWFAQNLGRSQWQEMADLCGAQPRQIYGMTETLAVVTAAPVDSPTPHRMGLVVEGRDVLLLDPSTRLPLPDGEAGVLTVAGRRGVDLFAGYLDDETADARAFDQVPHRGPDPDQVWFSTGDLVRRCDDGQLAFVGRVDDVVKVAGENVSLSEIEAAVSEAPGVLEAAVVAVVDPVRDHVPAAYVVARDPERPPEVPDLAAWAERHLTPAARPRTWTVIDELPRTSVGKVRRFRLASPDPS